MKGLKKDGVALVTGGSTGIGNAVVRAFANEGVRVIIADVNEKDGLATALEINNGGGEALFIKTDVSQAEQVEAMVNKIVETYGRLDYANNNAGIPEPGEPNQIKMADVPEADFDRVLQINLKGVWLCMKYEIKQMLTQGYGSIVNTSSVCGLVGSIPFITSYVTSKHGVVGLTKAAALDYAKDGIRINAVCPGGVLTPQLEYVSRNDPKDLKRRGSITPMGRLGKMDEIAAAVLWLCSDQSSYVHGYPLAVDGGYVAQ